MSKYAFIDTETTHTDLEFSQLTQFAGVLADEDLSIIDEFESRCRLMPHVLPHPGALTVTGVTHTELVGRPLSHYEMMKQVNAKLMEWGPAHCVGHNLLRFDEGILRQAFFQTLHDPYVLQRQGNTRGDTMVLAQLADACGVEGINIPVLNGKKSYKLGLLLEANGIKLDNAHDALADARGALKLAGLIRKVAQPVWDVAQVLADKNQVKKLLEDSPVSIYRANWYGRAYNFPVKLVTIAADRPSEALVFDLQCDPEDYFKMSVADLAKVIAGKAKPRAIRRIKLNGCPFIVPPDHDLADGCEFAEEMRVMHSRAELIRRLSEFQENVAAAASAAREAEAEVYPEGDEVEQKLFAGFASAADRRAMTEFHAAVAKQRIELAEKFEDGRFRELAGRIVALEHPEIAPSAMTNAYSDLVHRRQAGTMGCGWVCISVALEETVKMLALATGRDKVILEDYRTALDVMRAGGSSHPKKAA